MKRKSTGVSVKEEKWFSACSKSLKQPLKGRQKEIFTFIVEKGEVSLNHIKQHFGSSLSPLKTLEKKGAVSAQRREVFRKPFLQEDIFSEPVHELTDDQAKIIKQIEKAIQDNIFHPFLIHGVTGSGKTEIYLKVIEKVLMQGRQCLYLVPEISLTIQLWDRINSRLRRDVVMLHSSLKDTERFDAWRMIKKGKVNVVIGARSAIFASFSKLGAIVVDEEHDSSYKQDEKLRYNARDLALLKEKTCKSKWLF